LAIYKTVLVIIIITILIIIPALYCYMTPCQPLTDDLYPIV